MNYEHIESLTAYLDTIDHALLHEHQRKLVSYPKQSVLPWDHDALIKENAMLLNELGGSANIYAIYTSQTQDSDFTLRYIGKTTRSLARQRIKNHLFNKHEKTGSKLQQIISHVSAGGYVKVSWVRIEPESLRNYLEEELINRHRCADWNRENAKRPGNIS
ncbi:MAG TPA: hypothetical protein DIT18_14965 [Pseudomonas sp.]|nr:hypothetical protein [Pseudomonas sp.]